MSAHEVLIAVMAGFAVVGAVDRVLGNKLGLGEKFEEGILAMGSLAMAMLGIIALAPVLAALLRPVVVTALMEKVERQPCSSASSRWM